MFVISLFFYADWIPNKITQIIDFFPPQIELFKSSGVFLFFYILQKYKISQCDFQISRSPISYKETCKVWIFF